MTGRPFQIPVVRSSGPKFQEFAPKWSAILVAQPVLSAIESNCPSLEGSSSDWCTMTIESESESEAKSGEKVATIMPPSHLNDQRRGWRDDVCVN